MKKIESNLKKTSAGDQDAALKREINKIEAEVEQFKIELKKDYEKMFIEEKISMKNVCFRFDENKKINTPKI